MVVAFFRLVVVHAIGEARHAWRGERRLQSDRAIDRNWLEFGEAGAHSAQPLLGVVVAIEEDERVRRVIIGLVETLELLVGQVGDDGRVAAGVDAIGDVGESGLLAIAAEQVIGRRISALHLIEDDALEGQRRVDRFHLVMPPLLGQLLRRQQRVEDGVDVDVEQVVEVLQVGAGCRVDCLVGEGHGVDKRRQRAFHQFEERVLERVFLRTGQHHVLQNVGQAGGVGGRRAEVDAEHLVLVVVLQREELRARSGMSP